MTRRKLLDVTYRLVSTIPESITVGDGLLLDVEVTNTGAGVLSPAQPNPVGLSYHLTDPDRPGVVYEGRRTELKRVIYPDEQIRLELKVESPSQPGDYLLEIELVEENIAWFREHGIAPLATRIHYRPHSGPRACIVNGNVVLNDAVGNHVAAQMRALQAAGYQTLLLTEFIDMRLAPHVRRFAVQMDLADLMHPDARMRPAVDFFQSADIVIVNYSTYYDLAQAIKLVHRGAAIFDYHGVTPPDLWSGDVQGFRDLLLGQQHIDLVQYADYAIAHSEFTRDELLTTGLIPADRVEVLPYAVVSRSAYDTERDPVLIERYGLANRRILLYVGRMARNKRITDLVEALAIVRHHHPEAVLLLVGDNRYAPFRDYMAEVKQLAERLNCSGSIIWTGQVPDVEPFYRLCDLFVTASIHEGFCIPVVEAMAHGKPVIAAAATALPDTIGDAGMLFEPCNPADLADRIVVLLDDLPLPSTGDVLSGDPPDKASHDSAEVRLLRGQTIALVAPRYGLEILGGAERMVRGWAEELARRGYRTEVLTTCSVDMRDWSNYFVPGVEEINGVTVRRFATDHVNSGIFHGILVKANHGDRVSYGDEQEFVRNDLQSSALNKYLRDHADELACAVFAPYLFGTTYWGMQALPDKAVILPCLHDEPAARFAVFREMLEGAAGIFFNARAECALAVETLGVANPNRSIVGYGFELDAPAGTAAEFRERHNLPEQFVLYSGRLEGPKNVPLLLDYFTRYKREHPGSLALVLAGTGDVPIPRRPDIIRLGFVSDELPDAYASATVLCQPSVNESFSIVIMEAWLQQRPVLVHADCAVTADHVGQSHGGYTFADYDSFSTALQRLVNQPDHASALGQQGRAYVEANYSWDVVVDRFVQGIDSFVGCSNTYQRLAQKGIHRSLRFTRTRFDDALLSLVEQARQDLGTIVDSQRSRELQRMARVGMPGYIVQSHLPIVGRLIARMRTHLTSHLREPYLDPIVERQEAFNRELLRALLPLLEQSLHEQRRLRREVQALKAQVDKRKEEEKPAHATSSD